MQKKLMRIIFLLMIVMVNLIFCTKVSAKSKTNGFDFFNNAPRIDISANTKKYENVKIEIKDNNGIESVQFYDVDLENGKKSENPIENLKKGEKSTDKNWKYTIPQENFLKGNEKTIYIIVKDKTGNYRTKTYTIKDNGNGYKVSGPPTVDSWTADGKVSFSVKDKSGIQSIKIYDLNEETKEEQQNAKVVFDEKDLTKNKLKLDFSTKKFKQNNEGIYKVRIVAKDKDENTQIMTEKIMFSFKETDKQEETGNKNKLPGSVDQNISHEEKTEVSIALNNNVLMLDTGHYFFSDLKATISPAEATVKFVSSNPTVALVGILNGRVIAKQYGTAKITATVTYKDQIKTAECNVRVIAPSTVNTPECGAYVNYNNEAGRTSTGRRTYYIRNYVASQDTEVKNWSAERIEKQHWSNEEVESYINNAAYLLKTYPEKFQEGAEQKFYIHGTSNTTYKPTGTKVYTKRAGELVVDGGKYLLLFTTKNQCLYLLERNDQGLWKLKVREVCSSGYYWSEKNNIRRFSQYLSFGYLTPRNGNIYSLHPKMAGENNINDYNSIHIGRAYGRPASAGCIRIGSTSSTMWKALMTLFRDNGEPIKLIYY